MDTVDLVVRSNVQHSAALETHVARRVTHALRPFASRLAGVDVWLSDTNGPRRGAADKLARVVLRLGRGRRIVTTAASDDLYESVTQAVARARTAIARRIRKGRTPSSGATA